MLPFIQPKPRISKYSITEKKDIQNFPFSKLEKFGIKYCTVKKNTFPNRNLEHKGKKKKTVPESSKD